jgi:hypothetical protein
MKRRTLLASGGATVVGTGAFLYWTNRCPTGPTAIADLTNDSGKTVTVQGEVIQSQVTDNAFDIADGTGIASIGSRWEPNQGTCLRVTGTVSGCIGCDPNEYYIDPVDDIVRV